MIIIFIYAYFIICSCFALSGSQGAILITRESRKVKQVHEIFSELDISN